MVNEFLAPRPQDPARALEPYDPSLGHGPWDERLAAHLLRRAVGGPQPGQPEALARAAPAAAVDALFAPRDPAREESWHRAGAALAAGGDRALLAAWWLMKLAQEERAPGARLTLFWHDHFACAQSKVGDLGFLFAQHGSFAALGEGRFLDLLLALARDPALLRYLDGDTNRRGLPNENLAREVLELFTLGIGHHDEEDVREAARAFTGRIVRGRAYRFVPEYHDPGAKTVLGNDAPDGDAVCRAAVAHPECARFLAAKLWRFYVSPDPPAETISLLAERWRERDLDVAWLLRTLLGSRAFFGAESYRSLVKSPVDFVVGAVRAIGAAPDFAECARACAEMGQELFEPPGVQGWADGEAWMHSAVWLARVNFAGRVAEGSPELTRGAALDDLFPPRRRGDADAMIADLSRTFLGGRLPEARIRALRDALGGAADPDAGSAGATARFRACAHAILCAPEAQLA